MIVLACYFEVKLVTETILHDSYVADETSSLLRKKKTWRSGVNVAHVKDSSALESHK